MKEKKFFKGAMVCLSALGAMAMLTGCGAKTDRVANLNQSLVDACNTSVVFEDPNLKIEDFRLIGADVEKNGFTFDVNFNGLSSLSDETVGYAKINYNVPSSYFSNLEKDSSTDKTFDVFDKIVSDFKPESVSVAPVSDFAKINSAITKNEPQLYKGFKNDRSLLLNLSSPEFDEKNHTVSFDSKVLVSIKSGSTSIELGVGVGFSSGDMGLGLGLNDSRTTGTFIATDRYTINLTEDEFERMKENQSLVFDEVVKAINEKNSSKISASRKNVTSVTYENADLLKDFNVKKVSEEMGK